MNRQTRRWMARHPQRFFVVERADDKPLSPYWDDIVKHRHPRDLIVDPVARMIRAA